MIFETLGSLGLYVIASTGLSFLVFMTFLSVSSLGTDLALRIAAFITFLLYFLDVNITSNSFNLFSKVSLIG